MHKIKQARIHGGTEHQLRDSRRTVAVALGRERPSSQRLPGDGEKWVMTVNWSALGDVSAEVALRFADGLRALCAAAQADLSARAKA